MVGGRGVGHHRPMDNVALIDQYVAGPAEVRAALDGITATELDTRPAAGAWTAREIVHHLADSETNSYVRLRRMLVDDGTEIQVYDQDRWAADPRLGYDGPIEPPLAVLDAVRASSAALLRRLADADFARTGHHVEHDTYSVQQWLEIYAEHAHGHADQIRRARRGEP
jgi:DinB superfamily